MKDRNYNVLEHVEPIGRITFHDLDTYEFSEFYDPATQIITITSWEGE
jgi:hypothetical protein